MKRLAELISGLEIEEIRGDATRPIASLECDSRRVAEGTLFFALRGTRADGHDHIAAAVSDGAGAVVCERIPQEADDRATYIRVADSAQAMGHIASAFHDHPSRRLKLVGVTGTNGKTTVATLLSELFTLLGYKTGLISTVENRIGDQVVDSTHTTPNAIALNDLLARMADAGCGYCFMEVSSHGVVQRRTAGLEFAGGIFTNLTHDHLDYHGTFAAYLEAKKRFFDDLPKGAFALVNEDDRNGRVMVQNTRAAVSSYSIRGMADYRCRVVEAHFDGMLLDVDGSEVWVHFLGRFNASNLLAVYGAARLLGAAGEETLVAMSRLRPVNGRFEYLRCEDGLTAIVDYAHTPDALKNVLETVDDIRMPGQKIYVVAGCGGERDSAKRPEMGRIAVRYADLAILTSDNPRSEDPDEIIRQMREGIDPAARHLAITDRREAIRAAVMMAGGDDIIVVAGKGHETYQERNGVRTHFDDKEEIKAAFDQRRGKNK